MTQLYTSRQLLGHQTGLHVESPERLGAIWRRLDATGLTDTCVTEAFQPLDEDALAAMHDADVVRRVRELAAAGGGRLDPDTVVSPGSFEAGQLAAGAAVAAVDAVVAGRTRNALCLIRPPGHHATPSRSMGFCLFNNAALAAGHALKQLSRVLVVDFDVHHGNGTQDCFWDDGRVTFLSVHRYGFGFYPGTGAAGETGTGDGLGHTINVPVALGVSRREYHDAFARGLEAAAERSRPELVIVSAGFDAHHADPIGSLGLETEDFAEMTRAVLEVTAAHAGGRLVSCLEGGYDLDALADGVEAHLRELIHASPAG